MNLRGLFARMLNQPPNLAETSHPVAHSSSAGTSLAYPRADWAWIASDSNGYVAAFVTAGSAPIPLAVFAQAEMDPALEDAICELPATSEANYLLGSGNASSFLALARRGLFVYDWQDIHRIRRDQTGKYELVAVPATPCLVDTLPESVARHATQFRFDGLLFAQATRLDPRQQATCDQGFPG